MRIVKQAGLLWVTVLALASVLVLALVLAGCEDERVGTGGDDAGIDDARVDAADGGDGGGGDGGGGDADADTTVCGDGLAGAGEQCDGDDLAETTCRALGFDCGLPFCDGECRFDTSTCQDGVYLEDVEVVLTWDGLGDLNLHLVDDFGGRCVDGQESCSADVHCAPGDTCETALRREWGGAADNHWSNAQPDYGEPRSNNGISCEIHFDCAEFCQYPDCVGPAGSRYCTDTLDDPHLKKDESTGFGPENIELIQPVHAPGPPNVYHIGVYYFPDPVYNELRIATVRAFRNGVEIFAAGQPGVALTQAMDNSQTVGGAFWYAGWLIVTDTSATLVPSGLPTVDATPGSLPALQDPP